MVSISDLRAILKRFDGRLECGRHTRKEAAVCLLEAESVRLGIAFTDNPKKVRMFDLRHLNDIPVSPEVRTKHLLPVWQAYIGSLDWPNERKRAVAEKLVVLLVNRIIAQLPTLPAEVRAKCRNATTVDEAREAAEAAEVEMWKATEVETWKAARLAEEATRLAEARVAQARAAAAVEAAAAAAEEAAAVEAAAAAAAAAEEAAAWAAAARERFFIVACGVFAEAAS